MEKDIYRRMAAQETEHWWFTGRRSILRKTMAHYSPQAGDLAILEAGCGTGGNLRLLSEFGTVSGFELDEDACRVAARSGVPIVRGCLPDEVPFEDNSFDMIALFDVLEHVKEDRESLSKLYKLLKPGGRLFITVPAFPSLWSHHDVRHHHFRRYRKNPLKRLIEETGFQVIRLSHYNFLLAPIVVMTRLYHNLSNNSHSDDEKMPPGWLNRLLRGIFSFEGNLLMRMDLPVGISLMAVAERPQD